MRWITLLLVVFPFAPIFADEHLREIVVSATGIAQAAPDMATVRLGVSREARTASEAMAAVSEASEKILADIANAGIEARDVQTSSLSLNPVWDHRNDGPPKVRGYNASTMFAVRVRELGGLGDLLDTVVGTGANTLNGLSFSIAEPEPLQQIARTDAVNRAQRKAETLAMAAGLELGPVQSIHEGSVQNAPAPMMRGAMMEASAVPVAQGELDIRVMVTVVFAIAE